VVQQESGAEQVIVQEVQRFCRNAEVLRCRGSSRGDCAGAGAGAEQVQRCRGSEEVQVQVQVQVQVRRCGGAEVRRSGGAEVQSRCRAGAEVQRCRCVDV
jgi:hypothetical protein